MCHRLAFAVAVLLAVANHLPAEILIPTVPVGDPGNGADIRYNSISVGSVAVPYRIGTYEVTTGQYTAFLNAVATIQDNYGLYNTNMGDTANLRGCNIQQTYLQGVGYQYSVPSGWENRPVNYVSWGDAARFANWLHNGQPGLVSPVPQDVNSTEDGAYYLNGAMTDADLMAVGRKADANWWIPKEDEWYKAAYYDPHKPGGAGYWDYPTKSDTPPVAEAPPGRAHPPGSANYGWAGDETRYRTDVGAYNQSASPYGTFDQGGNVSEWNDTNSIDGWRGLRGGSFLHMTSDVLAARFGTIGYPSFESDNIGFRVATDTPEPGGIVMLVFGGVALLIWRWRRGRS